MPQWAVGGREGGPLTYLQTCLLCTYTLHAGGRVVRQQCLLCTYTLQAGGRVVRQAGGMMARAAPPPWLQLSTCSARQGSRATASSEATCVGGEWSRAVPPLVISRPQGLLLPASAAASESSALFGSRSRPTPPPPTPLPWPRPATPAAWAHIHSIPQRAVRGTTKVHRGAWCGIN